MLGNGHDGRYDLVAAMTDGIQERTLWIETNVLPYEREIRAWLKRNRTDGLEIDDIIQDMYAKIGALETFTHIRDPKRYAFQIAHSILVNFVRRGRIVSIASIEDLSALEVPTPGPSPEEQASLKDDLREISNAINALPERTRNVFMLRRIEGLSQRETANRLAIAEKTVEKHMCRATVILMDLFGRGGKEAPQASNALERLRDNDESDDTAD